MCILLNKYNVKLITCMTKVHRLKENVKLRTSRTSLIMILCVIKVPCIFHSSPEYIELVLSVYDQLGLVIYVIVAIIISPCCTYTNIRVRVNLDFSRFFCQDCKMFIKLSIVANMIAGVRLRYKDTSDQVLSCQIKSQATRWHNLCNFGLRDFDLKHCSSLTGISGPWLPLLIVHSTLRV